MYDYSTPLRLSRAPSRGSRRPSIYDEVDTYCEETGSRPPIRTLLALAGGHDLGQDSRVWALAQEYQRRDDPQVRADLAQCLVDEIIDHADLYRPGRVDDRIAMAAAREVVGYMYPRQRAVEVSGALDTTGGSEHRRPLTEMDLLLSAEYAIRDLLHKELLK